MEKKVAGEMIAKISDYILSPLAMGTHANYMAVKEGKSMLRRYDSLWGMKGPFTVSLFESDAIAAACAEEGIGQDAYSRFERISIIAAARALRLCPEINPADESVIFIISTTKGGWAGEGDPLPAESAGKIAGRFGNPNRPLVICNACISGLCAQTEAAAVRCFLHKGVRILRPLPLPVFYDHSFTYTALVRSPSSTMSTSGKLWIYCLNWENP